MFVCRTKARLECIYCTSGTVIETASLASLSAVSLTRICTVPAARKAANTLFSFFICSRPFRISPHRAAHLSPVRIKYQINSSYYYSIVNVIVSTGAIQAINLTVSAFPVHVIVYVFSLPTLSFSSSGSSAK